MVFKIIRKQIPKFLRLVIPLNICIVLIYSIFHFLLTIDLPGSFYEPNYLVRLWVILLVCYFIETITIYITIDLENYKIIEFGEKITESENTIKFNDPIAKFFLFYFYKFYIILFSILLVIFGSSIIVGVLVIDFIIIRLTFFLIVDLILFLSIRKLHINFYIENSNIRIKKSSKLRKLFRLKNNWVFKIKEINAILKEDSKIIFKLINRKDFVLKLSCSKDKVIEKLKDKLISKLEIIK